MTGRAVRLYAGLLAGAFVLGGVGAVGLNYLVDPLQFYRQARYEPVFSENQRYQNPGLARNYPYDTIVTGSSLMQAFLARDVEAALGGTTLRLPIRASSAREQAMVIEIAHRTGRLKRVIRDVHYNNLIGPVDLTRDLVGAFPSHLYDDNPWNDIEYLGNFETAALSIRALLIRAGLFPPARATLETLYTDVLGLPLGPSSVEASYRRLVASYVEQPDARANIAANIRENYARLATMMPDVQFIYILPPYSAAWYAVRLDDPAPGLQGPLEVRAGFKAAMAELPNVKVFDFQCREDLIFDFKEYRDALHFSSAIARMLLDDIAHDRNQAMAWNERDCVRANAEAWRDEAHRLLRLD